MIKALKYPGTQGLLTLLILLIVTDLSILLNVPILRQYLGFLFFIFVPGLLLIDIFRLKQISLTEKFILSIGLSVSFAMLVGVLANWVLPLFGIMNPLTTEPLLLTFNLFILIMAIIVYIINRKFSLIDMANFKLSNNEKSFLIVPAFFPLISIIGMQLLKNNGSNIINLGLIALILVYVVFICVKRNQVPEKTYPLIIVSISISLLLLYAFISNHIYGSDSHVEYYFFQATFNNGHLPEFRDSPLDACLSISIFPTVFQSFIDINPEDFFKLLYILPVSITPLATYVITKKYLGSFYAFLASIFLAFQNVFFDYIFAYRTYLAVLFFILAIMILFHERQNKLIKRLLFIFLSISCIVSHYSTAYIFFFILLLTWLIIQIIPAFIYLKNNIHLSKFLSREKDTKAEQQGSELVAKPVYLESPITITGIMIYFVIVFFWYSQITGAAFKSGVKFLHNTFISLQEFFALEFFKGIRASVGLPTGETTAVSYLGFVINWLGVVFIAIGVLAASIRYRQTLSVLNKPVDRLHQFDNLRIDREFVVIGCACAAILLSFILIPYIFVGYSPARSYYEVLTVLSSFFVIGGIMLTRFLHTRQAYLIIFVVLSLVFLNSTGTLSQILADPNSPILNYANEINDRYYVYDSEAKSAIWLNNYTSLASTKVYSDQSAHFRLISTALIRPESIDYRKITEQETQIPDGYLYLRYDNVVRGLFDRYNYDRALYEKFSTLDLQDKFSGRNLIYSSTYSQIWQ